MAGFISHLVAFCTRAIIKLLTSHLPSPHPLYPQLTCCFISWNSSPVHHTLVSSACWTPYCHEPRGPKQQKLIFSQFWGLEVLYQSVYSHALPAGSKEDSSAASSYCPIHPPAILSHQTHMLPTTPVYLSYRPCSQLVSLLEMIWNNLWRIIS